MRLTLFKLRQPKRFEFHARYYDADKEALQARIKRVKQELEQEKTGGASGSELLRSRLQGEWKTRDYARYSQRSNLRIFFLAVLLFFAFYILLFTDLLDKF